MTRLDEVAADERSCARARRRSRKPAALVAGPQLRTMGTLGGNVLLDTRCQWYNQTYFWRQALGFCLKKDGTLCHVVEGGSKCVAAASNDTAPALMTLGAELVLERQGARRVLPIDDFWVADGIGEQEARAGRDPGRDPDCRRAARATAAPTASCASAARSTSRCSASPCGSSSTMRARSARPTS